MSSENNKEEVIDLRAVWHKIKEKKKLFAIVLPTVFILSCLYIICIPRGYSTDTTVAPELNIPSISGSLSDIASSFGIDMSNKTSTDAIYPDLYPDLMEDNRFIASLFTIKVKSADGKINTDYYDYLKNHQEAPWWDKAIVAVKKTLAPQEEVVGLPGKFDPYHVSKLDDALMGKIRSDITINVDKKTSVISISTKAQDPLICKTIADSVRERLQDFITRYRTHKARIDVEYYEKLTADAKHEYERVRQAYGSYADANMDVVLQSYRSKTEDLENDMQLKYNAYTTLQTQLQAARAKLRERTPAFTLLKGASVPVKASSPKRMIFVLGMTILAFFITVFAVVRKDLHLTF